MRTCQLHLMSDQAHPGLTKLFLSSVGFSLWPLDPGRVSLLPKSPFLPLLRISSSSSPFRPYSHIYRTASQIMYMGRSLGWKQFMENFKQKIRWMNG